MYIYNVSKPVKQSIIGRPKFYAQEMQVLHLKLQWCSKQTAQNSALRKGKICSQEIEILLSEDGKFPKAMGNWIFRAKSGNSALKSKCRG